MFVYSEVHAAPHGVGHGEAPQWQFYQHNLQKINKSKGGSTVSWYQPSRLSDGAQLEKCKISQLNVFNVK